jgi:hypothetical protein
MRHNPHWLSYLSTQEDSSPADITQTVPRVYAGSNIKHHITVTPASHNSAWIEIICIGSELD